MMRWIVLSLALIASAANAADDGPYITGSFGMSARANTEHADVSSQVTSLGAVNPREQGDSSAGIMRVGVGYRTSRNFAVEASYFNLSRYMPYSVRFDNSGAGPWVSGTASKQYSSNGLALSVVAGLPLTDDFDLRARATYFALRTTVESQVSLVYPVGSPGPSPTPTSRSSSDHPLGAAIGLSYRLTDRFRLEVEYEAIGTLGKSLGQGDSLTGLRVVSFGFSFSLH